MNSEKLDKSMKFSSSCEKSSSASEDSCSVDSGMEKGKLELSEVFTIKLLPDVPETCFLSKIAEGTTHVDA